MHVLIIVVCIEESMQTWKSVLSVVCQGGRLLKIQRLKKSGVAAKQMWYFSIVPIFIRMFKCFESAKNLCWHVIDGKINGIMRHLANTSSWRLIDHMWSTFGSEPRNLLLGLSTNVINPFGDLSTNYSCWSVITTTYNLPPWLCMREKYLYWQW